MYYDAWDTYDAYTCLDLAIWGTPRIHEIFDAIIVRTCIACDRGQPAWTCVDKYGQIRPHSSRGVESKSVESHVFMWSRSRNIFCDSDSMLIILYVNCLKITVNNLHQLAYILSYGVSVVNFKSSTKH